MARDLLISGTDVVASSYQTSEAFMRKGLVCLVVLVAAIGARAEEWSKTYKVGATPTVNVRVTDARVVVTGWDGSDVEARVIYSGYRRDQLKIRESATANEVRLEVDSESIFCIGFCNYSMHVEVRVPKSVKLEVHSDDGRIEVSDLKGVMRLRAGDGRITVDRVDGELHGETNDGRIHASGRFDALELFSGDGGIEAVVERGSTMQTDYNIRTRDGRIQVDWPEQLGANIDAHTGDGHLDVQLPVTTTIQGRRENKYLRGTIGGGGKQLRLSSGDGSITVRRL